MMIGKNMYSCYDEKKKDVVMQRLLVTLCHSDGYTYSSEKTVPVLFSSKEEFIIQAEDLVGDYLARKEKYIEQNSKLQKEHRKISQEFAQVKDRVERSKPSEKNKQALDEASDKYMQSFEKMRKFQLENEPSNQFVLGGYQFEVENFYYKNDAGKLVISIPDVHTLDEFFYETECYLEQDKKMNQNGQGVAKNKI